MQDAKAIWTYFRRAVVNESARDNRISTANRDAYFSEPWQGSVDTIRPPSVVCPCAAAGPARRTIGEP